MVTYCFRMKARRFVSRAGGYIWRMDDGGMILLREHGKRGLPSGQGRVAPKSDLGSIAVAQTQGRFDWGNQHSDPTV